MATKGNDLIIGSNRNDKLFGLGGDDIIRGGEGNDFLVGGDGSNEIYGGNGNDIIFANLEGRLRANPRLYMDPTDWATSAIEGGAGNDIIVGVGVLNGGEGDDIIFLGIRSGETEGSLNEVDSGTGNDVIFSFAGHVEAGSGADTIVFTGSGTADIGPGYGYPGDGDLDRVIINGNPTGIIGLTGIDEGDIIEFSGVSGIKKLSDLDGRIEYIDDGIVIYISRDIIISISNTWGNRPKFVFNKTDTGEMLNEIQEKIDNIRVESVIGTEKDNVLRAKMPELDYKISGKGGNDRIYGSNGNDVLDGGAGEDMMSGGKGNDLFIVDNINDIIIEKLSGGSDELRASVSYQLGTTALVEIIRTTDIKSKSTIDFIGNEFSQTIEGNSGKNLIHGKDGNDVLLGDAGNDRLFGGGGNDKLSGGNGNDTFFFDTVLDARSNTDIIIDFTKNANQKDVISLENEIFTGLSKTGKLFSSAFKDLSAADIDKSDRIIYDHDRGALYYDQDGAGVKFEMIKFADLDNRASISASDFLIV
ncbi:calcium-binding protein [Methylobacterium sp. W2]|uniref:calcium-binding protein n=1 Tax=Methylobacterium sp. W2 TaxID=2598107 RepID=UPI001D0C1098|nr:calcium-binding protein [Methylobacterium sp. W2]MCC0806279.1 calcium-binding protein [Methylobacterium sp. W2]